MQAYEKYLDKVLHFLSFRPRTEKEIREFLHGKHTPLEIVEKVIIYLKDHQYVDDAEFARWWIEQRSKFRPKGERLVRLELRQKGVAQEIIDGVFENLESKVETQAELAKVLITKKISKYKGLPKQDVYRKLGAALARRGFDWETIKKAIDEVFTNGV